MINVQSRGQQAKPIIEFSVGLKETSDTLDPNFLLVVGRKVLGKVKIQEEKQQKIFH